MCWYFYLRFERIIHHVLQYDMCTYVGLPLAELDLVSDELYDIISNPQTPMAFAITCTEKNPRKYSYYSILP